MYSATFGKSLSKNSELIASLVSEGVIKSAEVESAMLEVDRGDFCPSD